MRAKRYNRMLKNLKRSDWEKNLEFKTQNTI